MNSLPQYAAFAILVCFAGYVILLFAQRVSSGLREARSDAEERRLLQAKVDQLLVDASFGQNRRKHGWAGFRRFVVKEKIKECEGVYSFDLVSHDGKPLQPFLPGQYLTFELSVPGVNKPAVRCYSLSCGANQTDYYRVSVKRIVPTKDNPNSIPGLVSNYFYTQIKTGSVVNVKSPGGGFFVRQDATTPIVLVAGGIGVTPLLSVLKTIVDGGSNREVWFFYGVHDRQSHLQKEYFQKVAAEHKNIHVHICYSHVTDQDIAGVDYHHAGHVTIDLLKQTLPSNNFDFYICGPGTMMQQIIGELESWGVPSNSIHFEAFGHATVKRVTHEKPDVTDVPAEAIQVTFSRSNKTIAWEPSAESLLDFAEANGIAIDSGCRAGNCGTCVTPLRSGKVTYLNKPGARTSEGNCLTCISIPKTSISLGA